MKKHYANANMRHHAFEAIQMETNGGEALAGTFRVTKRRSADAAYAEAEALCEAVRALAHKPAAFVREINAPGT